MITLRRYRDARREPGGVLFSRHPTSSGPGRARTHRTPRYLVVGYHGQAGGDQALHCAAQLAEDRSDTGLLVTYVTSLAQVVVLSGGMPHAVGPILYQEAEIAAHLAEQVACQLQDGSVEWRFLHKWGDVADELRALADIVGGVGIVVGQPRSLIGKIGVSVPARLRRSASQHIFVA